MNQALLLFRVFDCGDTDNELDVGDKVGVFGRDAVREARFGCDIDGFQHSHCFVCLADDDVFIIVAAVQFAELLEYFDLNHSLDDWKYDLLGMVQHVGGETLFSGRH